MEELHMYSVLPYDQGLLGTTDHFRRLKEKTGFPTFAVRRYQLHKRLVEFAQNLGIEVRWGHKLDSIEQTADDVAIKFANGAKETFSFVVGCDGLPASLS